MIYFTGDTHGDLERIAQFCKENNLTKDDVMIILGDVGLNYHTDLRGKIIKRQYSRVITCTLLCVHGNHEQNPEYMESMKEKQWKGGTVYYEEEYPEVLYAKDGEIYDLDGKKTVALGGAYSIDKEYRLAYGGNWFEDEQMSPEVMKRCEENLGAIGWEVHTVLSHTVPVSAEPVEHFIIGIDQSKVDRTMEFWLESIKDRLTYKRWLAGHYHCEVRKRGNIQIVYEKIKRF